MISFASFVAVWSFHKTNMALGFSSYSGSNASGVPVLSTATGVEPVVSTEIAFTFSAILCLESVASFIIILYFVGTSLEIYHPEAVKNVSFHNIHELP